MIKVKESMLYADGVLIGKASIDSSNNEVKDFYPVGELSGSFDINIESEYTQEKLDQMLNRSILGWEI